MGPWPVARIRMNAVGGAQHQLAAGPAGLDPTATQDMTMLTQQMAAMLAASMARPPMPAPPMPTAGGFPSVPYGLPAVPLTPMSPYPSSPYGGHLTPPMHAPWAHHAAAAGNMHPYAYGGSPADANGMQPFPATPGSHPPAFAPMQHGAYPSNSPGSNRDSYTPNQQLAREQRSQSADSHKDHGHSQLAAPRTPEQASGKGRGRGRAVNHLREAEHARSGSPAASKAGAGGRNAAGGPDKAQQSSGVPPKWSTVYDNPLGSEQQQGSGAAPRTPSRLQLQLPQPAARPPRRG